MMRQKMRMKTLKQFKQQLLRHEPGMVNGSRKSGKNDKDNLLNVETVVLLPGDGATNHADVGLGPGGLHGYSGYQPLFWIDSSYFTVLRSVLSYLCGCGISWYPLESMKCVGLNFCRLCVML